MQGLAFIASDTLVSVSRLDSGNLVHVSSTWTGDIPPELSQPPPSGTKTTCCLARILANYKDFFEQKSALKEIILARGYKCLFLLKFYCKLNPIEMY
jgi:hypothetical protein